MTNRFNPLDYPTCLMQPIWTAPSHWAEHVPFAFALIEMLRPRTVLELGVFAGTSYCAFCQAMDQLGLPSQAYGVDTWQGDPHNGSNGPEVLDDLKAHHDVRYGKFSRLMPSTFDAVLPQFMDGSIDLLHIDGYHTYEAVRHDFEGWLPKMSECGVILFHDINVHDRDFGVWKLWRELKERYRSFEFAHQHGLGVLLVGRNCPAALDALLECGAAETATIRDFYFQLGQRITQIARQRESERRLTDLRRRCAEAEQWRRIFSLQIDERNELLQKRIDERDELLKQRNELQYGRDELEDLRKAVARLAELDTLRVTAAEVDRLRVMAAELTAIKNSKSYRLAGMLTRCVKRMAPAGSLRRDFLRFTKRCAKRGRPRKILAFFRKATHRGVNPR